MFKTLTIIRPINLIIIVLTMMMIQFYFYTHSTGSSFLNGIWWLKVSVMVSLAASGNIINDFFDQEIDTYNQRYNAIASMDVSIKKAFLWYGSFVLFGILSSLILFYITNCKFYLTVPLLMFFGLFIYTPILKKTVWWGNIWVSLCLAIVPIWTAWGQSLFCDSGIYREWVLFFSAFAFLINWSREIIKDVQDARGDQAFGCKSLFLNFGLKNTVIWIQILFFLNALLALLFLFSKSQTVVSSWMIVLLMVLPSLHGLYQTKPLLEKSQAAKMSKYLKIWMVVTLLAFMMVN